MERPDPDRLLAQVQPSNSAHERAALKIFFGAAAGVGKTYAMLEAAHDRLAEGIDVVAGYIETHGRDETSALLAGLEVLPRRQIDYRGTVLEEFDLDAALERKPQLILVDELAHTNAQGARHAKRWQDVEELLAAGISVYTTVNVQHLESLNDVVAQITGVIVRETVPDSLLERADEVELIDLPPDELLQRLREGKIYRSHQIERAANNFFRKGNLIALRELSLRRTADRVDDQMQRYRRDNAINAPWPTTERLLVCVGPGLNPARLVRAARRMAAGLRAEWVALYVETPAHLRLPEDDRERIVQTLRLAEQLGAETVTLSGSRASDEILAYAHTRNVTKIVVGKPEHPRWRELIFGSTVDSLVRRSGMIDVYILSEQADDEPMQPIRSFRPTSSGIAYGRSVLIVLACTLVAWAIFPAFEHSNLIMVYLLGTVFVANRYGRGPAILASILSVAAFDFFFVTPYLTFAVSDVQYLITFGVMLSVALVISSLAARLRQQADAARLRERRTAALYELSRELASKPELEQLLQAAVRHVSQVFESQVVVLLPPGKGDRIQPWGHTSGWWDAALDRRAIFAPNDADRGVAQWSYERQQMAGRGTNTLPGAEAIYLPLIGSRGTVGVLGVKPKDEQQAFPPEQIHLLETFASQTALAIERAMLARQAQQAQLDVEAERLRSSLLSSVSHDLRTPLAAITGATSSLLQANGTIDGKTGRELIQGINDEAFRLNRLVSNLLDMTQIESGNVRVQKEWQSLEEVVGAALTRLDARIGQRPVEVEIPPDLPLVPFDSVLIEQVLINLLENALKYTPADSPLKIASWIDRHDSEGKSLSATVEVADRGPGIQPTDHERVFEKFYRAQQGKGGVGLGLAICHAIVQAHGGRIWVEDRPGGGASFRFTLPIEGTPPRVMMLDA